MFTVEYFNKAVYITAYNIRRINFPYYTKLRKLIIMGLKQSCEKIVINFLGVRMIDRAGLEMLKLMQNLASDIGIQLIFINTDDDLRGYISKFYNELEICFSDEAEYEEYRYKL